MATPDFLRDAEAEELDDLAAIGVDLDGADQAALDAAASENLRRLAGVRRNLARYEAALERELDAIRSRYARIMVRDQAREVELVRAIETLAARADFGKRAQSRKVGYGVYGRKAVPAKVKVTDTDEAIAALRAMGREDLVVREEIPATVVEKVRHKEVAPVILALFTGEASVAPLPAGFEVIPGRVDYYGEPTPLEIVEG